MNRLYVFLVCAIIASPMWSKNSLLMQSRTIDVKNETNSPIVMSIYESNEKIEFFIVPNGEKHKVYGYDDPSFKINRVTISYLNNGNLMSCINAGQNFQGHHFNALISDVGNCSYQLA